MVSWPTATSTNIISSPYIVSLSHSPVRKTSKRSSKVGPKKTKTPHDFIITQSSWTWSFDSTWLKINLGWRAQDTCCVMSLLFNLIQSLLLRRCQSINQVLDRVWSFSPDKDIKRTIKYNSCKHPSRYRWLYAYFTREDTLWGKLKDEECQAWYGETNVLLLSLNGQTPFVFVTWYQGCFTSSWSL